jgi:hypothetical protein
MRGMFSKNTMNLLKPLKLSTSHVFLDPNTFRYPNSFQTFSSYYIVPAGIKYEAYSFAQINVAKSGIIEWDSVVTGRNPRPTCYYTLYRGADTCQSILNVVIATSRSGWSTPCYYLVKPLPSITTIFPKVVGLSLETSGQSIQYDSGVKFIFGQMPIKQSTQMPITQSTIASVPILTSSTATSGWLSLSAVPGVEYSLSSTGTWQPSLRVEWRSGQPKLERLWLRYTPQAIGQNFPIIRYVVNDSCDTRNHGLLRLEALATQPTSYAYTITSVRDAKALEPVLEAVYPNPTSSDVTFALSLSKASRVKLTVCTTLGSILQTVADAPLPAGRHSMTWQSIGLPSGVYGYRLEVDGASVQSGFVSVVR